LRTRQAPSSGWGHAEEARREATLDDRVGLAARVAADLLPEAGDWGPVGVELGL
jgi:hypothetical protein